MTTNTNNLTIRNQNKTYTHAEVAQHNTIDDCWIIIEGKVYDISGFIRRHPGGTRIIEPYFGKDATKAFLAIHNTDYLEYLPQNSLMGSVAKTTQSQPSLSERERQIVNSIGKTVSETKSENEKPKKNVENEENVGKVEKYKIKNNPKETKRTFSKLFSEKGKIFALAENKVSLFDKEGKRLKEINTKGIPEIAFCKKSFVISDALGVIFFDYNGNPLKTNKEIAFENKPPLSSMINSKDFEKVAKAVMKKEQLDYYQTGAEDEYTLKENMAAFQRIWLRPRVLSNPGQVDLRCTLFGTGCSMPLILSATAMGKYADPKHGELSMVRGAFNKGVIFMVPTMGSLSFNQIAEAKAKEQTLWAQLYINPTRSKTQKFILNALEKGVEVFVVTVDAPKLGKRERDMRNKFVSIDDEYSKKKTSGKNSGTSNYLTQFIDPSITWNIVAWIQSFSPKIKVVIKGIQTPVDAVKALQSGCAGIIVSNHGGRQIDTCLSPIEMLPAIMRELKNAKAPEAFEVYVDGGVRRGRDIFKALALGAKAVGIGRPYLYALAGYRQKGLERLLDIFRQELETCMQLCGCAKLSDIDSSFIDLQNITNRTTPRTSLL